jgi:hypothetical protein
VTVIKRFVYFSFRKLHCYPDNLKSSSIDRSFMTVDEVTTKDPLSLSERLMQAICEPKPKKRKSNQKSQPQENAEGAMKLKSPSGSILSTASSVPTERIDTHHHSPCCSTKSTPRSSPPNGAETCLSPTSGSGEVKRSMSAATTASLSPSTTAELEDAEDFEILSDDESGFQIPLEVKTENVKIENNGNNNDNYADAAAGNDADAGNAAEWPYVGKIENIEELMP